MPMMLYTPSGPWVPRVPPSPQYTPDTPTPLIPTDTPKTVPYIPTPPRNPPMSLMSLYPFWPWVPTVPASPQYIPNTPTPPSFQLWSCSIVVTLQLTIFIQLKHSFLIVIVFNYHHFATDHLHAVKMLIFYCCHLQLSSLCNWPSSGVCPGYNIPFLGVKGTSSVLWSSANFCSISKNMH